MTTRSSVLKLLRQIGVPVDKSGVISSGLTVMAIAACLFLFYSGLQGNHGLIQQRKLEDQRLLMERELHDLQSKVAFMKNKTERLSDQFLDLELLDERVRRVLGYVREDEFVVN
ncbi:MAG: septum formation initiator family protein [Rhodobacteraceae bacterium]|nr:septum formation initiator family protein [Paracoccaceae bacterium]